MQALAAGNVVAMAGVRPPELLTCAEMMAVQPPPWCVRGVLPQFGLAIMYGPSGSGKSFLAIDLALSLGSGLEFLGHGVKKAPVTYLALEASGGIGKRVTAWHKHHGCTSEVLWRIKPFSITDDGSVREVAKVVPHAGVIIVDTLNRAAPAADENNCKDMSTIIDGANTLARLTTSLVILIHHTGKNAAAGPRGHSSLYAAADAVIEVRLSAAGRAWSVAKSKDDESGAVFPFKLHRVELGHDADGEPVSSCVVVPDGGVAQLFASRPKGGTNQRLVMAALEPLLTGGPLDEVAVQRAAVGALPNVPKDKRQSIARKTVESLVANRSLSREGAAIRFP